MVICTAGGSEVSIWFCSLTFSSVFQQIVLHSVLYHHSGLVFLNFFSKQSLQPCFLTSYNVISLLLVCVPHLYLMLGHYLTWLFSLIVHMSTYPHSATSLNRLLLDRKRTKGRSTCFRIIQERPKRCALSSLHSLFPIP